MGNPNGGKFKKKEKTRKKVYFRVLCICANREAELRMRGPRGSGGASRYVYKSMESARYVGCDHTGTKAPDPIRKSKVNRAWARVVLGWVTSWDVLVLHSFFVIFFASLHGIYNYGESKWC